MQEYETKPNIVKAMQYSSNKGDSWAAFKADFDAADKGRDNELTNYSGFVTLKTPFLATQLHVGDWIIINARGVVFFAHDDAFLDAYTLAEITLDPAAYTLAEITLDPAGGTNENPLGD